MASKQGILDLGVLDYTMVFDTKVNLNLSKAERLIYGDSEMNHAIIGIIIIIIEMTIANILSLLLIAAIPDHSNAIFGGIQLTFYTYYTNHFEYITNCLFA